MEPVRSRGGRPMRFLLGAIFLMMAVAAYDGIAAKLWPRVPGDLNLAWHALSGIFAAGGAFLGVQIAKLIERRSSRSYQGERRE